MQNFEWDEKKNQANIRKHQIDFADAQRIFNFPLLKKPDRRRDYGEDRWFGLGLLDEMVVAIIYTIRGNNLRVISIRKADRHERKIYQESFNQ